MVGGCQYLQLGFGLLLPHRRNKEGQGGNTVVKKVPKLGWHNTRLQEPDLSDLLRPGRETHHGQKHLYSPAVEKTRLVGD
jgi:hypothetical protein